MSRSCLCAFVTLNKKITYLLTYIIRLRIIDTVFRLVRSVVGKDGYRPSGTGTGASQNKRGHGTEGPSPTDFVREQQALAREERAKERDAQLELEWRKLRGRN